MSGEARFVEGLRALANHEAARRLLDDTAVLQIGGESLVLTHDMMVEGVHFLPNQDMADVAWKLVASNLSDLAAKGAAPVGVLLGYTLGKDDESFLWGLAQVLGHYDVPLLGGDTVSGGGGARTFGLTALGRATHVPPPSRAGAQPGDGLFVTGVLGAAMVGFDALNGTEPTLSAPYRRPNARLTEGQALAPLASAMMDVSDGLLLDAFRMAEASQVSIAIDSTAAPVADPTRRLACLSWGDDYELLFTLPPGTEPPVPATRIGTVEPRGFVPLFVDEEPVSNSAGLGYQHG